MNSQYKLKDLNGSQEFLIENASSMIGRSEFCDFQINASSLSREHARILVVGGEVSVEDLHSTNGTFVNEKAIEETTKLKLGDVIRFGEERYALQDHNEDATVMFDSKAFNKLSESSMMVEDDEEEDATVMMQAIALPPGWEDSNDFAEHTQGVSSEDQKLIVALQAHAANKLQHKNGLIITVTSDSQAPVVKLLSTDSASGCWKLGRGDKVDIRLSDSTVSSLHAKIELEEGVWRLVDSASRNGTFLGKRRIENIDLVGSQSISIGPFTILTKTLAGK